MSSEKQPVVAPRQSEWLERHAVSAGFVLMFAFTWPIDLWAAADSRGWTSSPIETTSTLVDRPAGCVSTLSVVISRRIGLASSRSFAGPVSSAWLTAAYTAVAPRSTSTRAASVNVPEG